MFWHQLVQAPGEARSDLWQIVEFSKRFTTDEVWPAEILDANPGLSRQDAVRRAVPQRQRRQVPASEIDPDYENDEAKAFGFYIQKGLFEEYAAFGRGHGHDLAPYDRYHGSAGCAGRSSTARRRSLALSRGLSIPLRQAGRG